MTRSSLERTCVAVAAFLAANLNTYITRANLGTTGIQAPAIKKAEHKSYIPDTGPFPFAMVTLDQAAIEPSANNAQRITATLSVNICVGAQPSMAAAALDNTEIIVTRYMDALIDLFGENMTIGGAVEESSLDSIDKAVLPADGKGFVLATVRTVAEVETV
jgi:hypothetical protein